LFQRRIVSSPSRSRRRFLALTTATAAGVAGCASLPDGAVPARLVRERTRRLSTPTPETTVPVLESHVDAYRERLARVVPRAETRWSTIGRDDLPRFPEYTHDDVEEARSFLTRLDSKPRTSATVDEAAWRLRQAVGALAYARARAGEFDLDGLYTRARETLATFDSLTPDHACIAPARYLPYGRRIDRQRWWGRREASAVVPGTEVDSGADRGTPSGTATLAGQHAMAAARLLDVRQYREAARTDPLGVGRPTGDRRAFADALTRNVRALAADVEPLVRRFETFEDEHDSFPDGFANGVWGRGMRGRNELAEGRNRTRNGYPGLGAGKTAAAFVHSHAFVDALETLDPESPPTADAVFDEKRAATRALRERLDSTPSPVVHDHLRLAAQALTSGDLTLKYFDRHDDITPARSYTEAWVDYHAAAVAAERAADVASVLTRR
jgi:hypothetical protein